MAGKSGMKVKNLFFDREAVLKALGRARLKVLKEQGRLVRKRAQSSLTYADGPSAPGEPPHAHRSRTRKRVSKSTGKTRVRTVSFLREFLYFSFDPASQSVVVGPERLDTTVDPRALPALEYGGPARVKSRGATRQVTIPARPFMRPALAAEKPGFERLWKDSVK